VSSQFTQETPGSQIVKTANFGGDLGMKILWLNSQTRYIDTTSVLARIETLGYQEFSEAVDKRRGSFSVMTSHNQRTYSVQ
jgi:hypothetical protein